MRLATLWCEAQRHGEALPLQQVALEHWIRTRGPDHLGTAMARHHLATTLATLGEHELARQELDLALQTQRRRLGEAHADTLASQTLLSIMAFQRGELDDAIETLHAAHRRCVEALGEEHNETMHTAHWLGAALLDTGALDGAEPLITVVHAARRGLPMGNPHRTETTRLLVRLRLAQGDLHGSIEPQRELIQGVQQQGVKRQGVKRQGVQRQGAHGRLHAARATRDLAATFVELERWAEATELHEAAIELLCQHRRSLAATAPRHELDRLDGLLADVARAARPIAHRVGDRDAAARMAVAVADAAHPLEAEPPERSTASDPSPGTVPPHVANLATEWRLAAVDDFIAAGRFKEAATMLALVETHAALLDNPHLLVEHRRQRDRLQTAPIDRQVRTLREAIRAGS